MAKKNDVKISQPVGPTLAEIEILKERIGNMEPVEQKVVASELRTSVILEELLLRLPEMGNAIHLAANDLRRVQKAWLK